MSDARHLFRQTALDRLSSPDQLDHLLPATTPARWVALIGFALLTAAAVVWCLTGEVSTRVEARGVLIARGGSVVNAVGVAGGLVQTITVRTGDVVAKSQVLARIAQPGLEQALATAQTEVTQLAAERSRLEHQFAVETDLKRDALTRQRTSQKTILEAAQQRAAFYLQALNDLDHQVEQGYITRQRSQDARQAWQGADEEVKRAVSDLAKVDADELDDTNRHGDELTRAAMRSSAAERRLAEAQSQLTNASVVLAPTAGTVVEIQAQDGTYAAAGAPLVGIQTGAAGLEYLMYVPTLRGKQVEPGMTVQIEPAGVKKEEYGTLLGTVAAVSAFPATAQGMMAVLQNPALVQEFSTSGPPYAAHVALRTRDGAGDAYLWSAGTGPPTAITSGTLATAEVTVRRQRPIALVVPTLNRLLDARR